MVEQKKEPKPATDPNAPIVRQKTDDFISRYANYSYIESSLWDMKIHFGQTDQSLGDKVIPVNAAITLPWAQVKVLSYFLQVHLKGYEADHGRIKIPVGIIPPALLAPFREMYEKFINENPEAAGEMKSK